MVSFSCEVCNDTVVKRKLQQHQRQCRGAYFTCIDCSNTFYGNDHQSHTSCISEAEKYEKGLYKGKKKTTQQQYQYKKPAAIAASTTKAKEPEKGLKEEAKKESDKKKEKKGKSNEFDIKRFIEKEPTSLYKIFKQIKKENSKISDKSEFLKLLKLNVNTDGTFSVTL